MSLYCQFIDTVGTQTVISESDQWQICHGSSVIACVMYLRLQSTALVSVKNAGSERDIMIKLIPDWMPAREQFTLVVKRLPVHIIQSRKANRRSA